MKRKLLYILLIFSSLSFSNADKFSKETVVYIVRHAEKDSSDRTNLDPGLSAQGKTRAKDLMQALKKEKFAGIFSTPFNRTLDTAKPLAQISGLPILTYPASDFEAIAHTIKTTYLNRVTLIVGHSNTILEIAKALGTQPPVLALQDNDYDLLLKVTIDIDGKSDLKISRYGKKHHSTELTMMNR